jgi:hypothetical protein
MARKRRYTHHVCRIRDCGSELAVQNRSGFCAKCTSTRTADVARLDPKWAAKRKAYYVEWRAKNVKQYGKTRPTHEEMGKPKKKGMKLPSTKAGLEALIRKALRAA